MGRKKIRIERIQDRRLSKVTFVRRSRGLLKKAEALATMCKAKVGVIIFSATKRVEPTIEAFGETSIDAIIQKRYLDKVHPQENPLDLDVQQCMRLRKKYDDELLLVSQLEGKKLENSSREHLEQLEEMLQDGLRRVKAKVGDENVANQERAPDTALPPADFHGEDIPDSSLSWAGWNLRGSPESERR